MTGEAHKHSGLKHRAMEELRAFWIITFYLFLLIGTFMVYRRLLLSEFDVVYLNYGFAFFEALIIAKVIMIGDALKLGRRFESGPLAVSVIYKSLVYGGLVFFLGALEHVLDGLTHKQNLDGIVHGMIEYGVYELLARTVMMFGAFIPFFAFWEVGRVIGPQKLAAMFFGRNERTS
ncbi:MULTISPECIES: hypothetical protein [Cupriavidus]|uniref:Uncharacterized protein n=1 Tax=Cupriavidus pinatubonensis (strain JMP 134 / LMG 1197) TaxID=264198 RepID=Q473C6_CUPPJ|nr:MULTISPECIES: hypothetical protein [Cupriavidus]QYY32695.1 hypothetical protein K2O51_18165 [Cupriavidus pinatubonensis]TPQ43398.1 hypothetical protein C2U69_02695 [Cupriavidus pinatubonensis]